MIFIYKSKGSADDWSEDKIEADSIEDAIRKLEKMYNVERDEDGAQTNSKYIQVEVLREDL